MWSCGLDGPTVQPHDPDDRRRHDCVTPMLGGGVTMQGRHAALAVGIGWDLAGGNGGMAGYIIRVALGFWLGLLSLHGL
jgi:hypothetical protein